MADDSGYDTAAVAGAALGGQRDPGKRSQLRTWAWVSGALLLLQAVVLLVLALVTL